MTIKTLAVPVLLSCAVGTVYAEPLKGSVELGFVQTTGNTETSNINLKLGLTKETENWKHVFNASALSSSSEDQTTGEDETTAEKYTADAKSERNLDERSYLYALATYEDDRFSGFDYQATAGVGYGYKLIAEENLKLAVELGSGYRYNELSDGENEDEVTLRFGETLEWAFSETATFEQYFNVEGGDENTITKLGVSLESSLTGALALKMGIDAKHTENPGIVDGEEADDLDTETYANITYKF